MFVPPALSLKLAQGVCTFVIKDEVATVGVTSVINDEDEGTSISPYIPAGADLTFASLKHLLAPEITVVTGLQPGVDLQASTFVPPALSLKTLQGPMFVILPNPKLFITVLVSTDFIGNLNRLGVYPDTFMFKYKNIITKKMSSRPRLDEIFNLCIL
jgi:hypothetical protein